MSRRVLHSSYEDKRAERGRRRGNSSFPRKKVSRGKLSREYTEHNYGDKRRLSIVGIINRLRSERQASMFSAATRVIFMLDFVNFD